MVRNKSGFTMQHDYDIAGADKDQVWQSRGMVKRLKALLVCQSHRQGQAT